RRLAGKHKPDSNKLMNEVKRMQLAAKKLNRANNLFRSNSVVSMISTYEEYFRQLLQTILGTFPERFKHPEKVITYEELSELRSLDEIKEKFIEKELDKELRKSTIDQFKYLENLLSTSFSADFKAWSDFLELLERRNLFVHCGGVVSRQYLKVCNQNKI